MHQLGVHGAFGTKAKGIWNDIQNGNWFMNGFHITRRFAIFLKRYPSIRKHVFCRSKTIFD